MEPFLVTCETCRARLRVRDPGIIGEIHACPKCGSMVHVVPPPGWSPPVPDDAQPAPSETSRPAATTAGSAMVGEAVEIDALVGEGTAAGEATPAAVAPPVPPPASLASRWVLWSAAGVGLLVVGGLLVAVGTRGRKDNVAALPPAAAEPAAAVAPVETGDAPEAPTRSEDASGRSEDASVASNGVGGAVPSEGSEDASEGSRDASEGSEYASGENRDASGGSKDASGGGAPSDTKFDPLSFDPSQLSLSSSGVAEMAPEGSEDAGGGSEDASERVGDVAEGRESESPLPRTAAVELGPASSDALRMRDVAKQLALKLDAVDLPQVPLARAVEMISDMADVPITLEPSALEMSGISPGFPVTLHAEDVTIGDLLQTALAQANLAYKPQGGQIVIVKPDVDGRRGVNYRVDDLVAPGAADAAGVAELIKRFVAPQTWQSAAGKGTITVDGATLRVEQSERVLYEILTFCERLRLARGLATRSRYPVDRLCVQPLYPQLAERLSAKTTFTFLPWSRLADVLRYWERAAGVTVLVDWPALAEAGLGPSSPVACAVADRPWSDAFDAVLAPLGLAWRAVDPQTIQVTSRDAAERTPQMEFYPVPERLLKRYASPDALVAALMDEAKKQVDGNVSGGTAVEIALDSPSRRLVVLAPPAVQRYLSGRLAGE